MKEDVFAYIDDHKAQMMDLWQDLVNQDSPASYREGVDLVAKRVFKELEEAGASTRWDEEGKALMPVKETVMCAALTDYNCAKNPMCVAPKETVECSSEIKMAPQSFIIVEIK